MHEFTTRMSTLIMWHNRFSENGNKAMEAHIPRQQDSKTKKPRHRDSGTKTPRHREIETRSHDIEMLRLKNHDIEISGPKINDIEIWVLKHHNIEKRRQISHNMIPRMKNHIKIPRPESPDRIPAEF